MDKPEIATMPKHVQDAVAQLNGVIDGHVAAKEQSQMKNLVAGLDLSAFKAVRPTGGEQTAALNNEDMSRGTGGKGIA